MDTKQLTEAQKELLEFMNETDSKDIASGLRKVFNMAVFDNNCQITCKQKDDLFYLEKIISIAEKM